MALRYSTPPQHLGLLAEIALKAGRADAEPLPRAEEACPNGLAPTTSTTLTIVSTWPRDFPGLGTSAQRLAARITEVSNGAIQTEYFAAGERVGAFDVFDEVASGNSQAYIAADYYWKGKHPGWAYFTAVPFGLTVNEFNAWYHFGGGEALHGQGEQRRQ